MGFNTLLLMLVLVLLNAAPAEVCAKSNKSDAVTAGQVASSKKKSAKEVKIYFHYRSARLLPEEALKLEPLCKYLKKHSRKRLLISGFSSTEGKPNYNMLLSGWRAEGVRNWLEENGIAEKRITIQANGDAGCEPKEECRSAFCVVQ